MWKELNKISFSIRARAIKYKMAQAKQSEQTYFTHQGKKYPFKYESGGRRGGKRLLIWDSSEERAEISREIAESVEKRTIKPPINTDSSRLSVFSTASDAAQAEALRKQHAIKEFLKAKDAKLEVKKFIKSYNERFPETELTQRKLYHWIALYKENGLDALIDHRGLHTKHSKIKEYNLDVMINKLIMSSTSKIKVSQLSKMLHIRLADQGYINFYEYISEGKQYISRQAIHEYLRAWKRANPLAASYIEKGEDKTISYMMHARWSVERINELWEMDESPLDMMVLDENGKHVRAKLFNVIDVHSSRTVMTIAREGDSYAAMRLIIKAIEKFGKPIEIKGDNGKNFLSAHVQGALANMGINYEATPAYQGWSKPFAERVFKKIQHSLVESLPGYIEHNVGERTDIEASVSLRAKKLSQTGSVT